MATRGTVLPPAEQARLQRLRERMSVRRAAREAGVSTATVRKYTGRRSAA